MPTTGTPARLARRIVRAIVSPPAEPKDPPRWRTSCVHTHTERPPTRAEPATTPSPTAERHGWNVLASSSAGGHSTELSTAFVASSTTALPLGALPFVLAKFKPTLRELICVHEAPSPTAAEFTS